MTRFCQNKLAISASWLLFFGVLIFLSGCGTSKGRLSGKVYQKNGQPLPGGRLGFYRAESGGNPVFTSIQEDGSYEVRDVPMGPVRITVENEFLNPKNKQLGLIPSPGDMPGMPKGFAPPQGIGPPPEALEKLKAELGTTARKSEDAPQGKYVPIDPKYANPATTDLSYEVKPGDQQYDIHLK
jgi:hypothetical protein